tara:strand:- start:221 stop:346 length:126 start_codon:yes stop_codon:yes gene_type:complete
MVVAEENEKNIMKGKNLWKEVIRGHVIIVEKFYLICKNDND